MFLFLCLIPVAMKGQTTKDQLKEIRSTVVETQDGNEYYIHTIKRGQTLYMISKAYGVEVNDLIRENPQVKEGIKADQKLRIPLEVKKPVKVELPCGIDSSTKKPVYNVALMLPLFLDEVDTLNAENPSPEIYENSKSLQFLPFYEGFRMALDSLEKSGLKIRLYVYDVDKDTVKTRRLLQKPELKSMDLIFGLLYHRNFQIVAAFAEKNRINIVNPISERSELVSGNPFVIKVRPSKKAQYAQLAEYMAAAFYRGQVLIVRSGQFPDHDAPELLRKECNEHKLNVQVVEGQEAAIGLLSKDTRLILHAGYMN
jgi:LysM repeat protein